MLPPDECPHLRISSQGVCHTCGIHFRVFWRAKRSSLFTPLSRNIGAIGILAAVGVVMVGALIENAIVTGGLVALAVFFMARLVFAALDLFMGHYFYNGTVGLLSLRSPMNILAVKEAWVEIGSIKFPMDQETYRVLNQGQRLLVEYLRWSRLPVALYKVEGL
jgi:hypothetical protein